MFPIFDSRYLYTAMDFWYRSMALPSEMFKQAAIFFDDHHTSTPNDKLAKNYSFSPFFRRNIAAKFGLLRRLTQSYVKPAFGIHNTHVNGKEIQINEEVVFETPFCKMLHFKKDSAIKQPRLLMIAPMAGHYATLLRDTVRDSLPHYDIYVTDWTNARDVPISQGGFDMDSYIAILVRCFEFLAPDFHIMGICQSGVPAYAAISLLENRKEMHEILPKTLTIMGSPIDVRCSPTAVNTYAAKHDQDWFESMALSIVPQGFEGERRLVYPGFMQLAAFLSMHPERHEQSIRDAIHHYVEGDFASEEKISSFYGEYFSVMDLTAEFYLQTVRVVFQEALLPRGKMVSRGKLVDPKAIRKTAIFAVEGELDDICGLGQTRAVLTLAENLPESKKSYLLLEGSGHYGLFNGHRYQNTVLPALLKFTASNTTSKVT